MLATNVAETSLTVPGIKYVIDPGTARISRYSHRLKVQRLPIEPISQASANQRKGRCGRTSDGICIRLYSEEDFAARPEFTDPEILRTNLASVILQMTALGLGDIAAFPFVDPPDRRNITDGVAAAARSSARSDAGERTTAQAHRRSAASWPSCRSTRGWPGWCSRPSATAACARCMVIAAALSIQDPRERPADKQQAADEKHARFADPDSDFLALPQPVALPAGAAAGAVRPTSSAGCAAPSSSTTCGSASGRTSTASCARWPSTLGISPCNSDAGRRRSRMHTVAAGRPAVPHRPEGRRRSAEYLGRPRRAVRDLPRLGAVQEDRRAG